MPQPPRPLQTPLQRDLSFEGGTPRKVPRPPKRRRREQAARPGQATGEEGWPSLELALALSFAALDAKDIVATAAACPAWRCAAGCRTLWSLAAPRLGLSARVVQRLELSRRRSRGTVAKGVLLGEKRQAVALRSVDLRGANAGCDDGLLPSVLRECAFLRALNRLGAPGLVRLVGAEVLGEQLHMATEYANSSFQQWFAAPRAPTVQLRAEIRHRFAQLLEALSFLHGAGVLHRNVSPSNVLLDLPSGRVLLCDLACGRALDAPLRPYSPEDPKLRPQSTREARRLWYRAPELLLRQRCYGPAVDVWAAGTLLAEAATGLPLFASESEVDHLFRVFRLTGSPSPSRWPDALACPAFSPRFPVYEPLDLRLAARAAAGDGSAALELRLALGSARAALLEPAVAMGQALGDSGLALMAALLRLDPEQRCGAADALACPFLKGLAGSHAAAAAAAAAALGTWEDLPSQPSQEEAATPSTGVAKAVAGLRLGSPGGATAPASLPGLWKAMARLEAALARELKELRRGRLAATLASNEWACIVDGLIALAQELQLGDGSLHLAVALLEEERLLGGGQLELDLAAAACLKLADGFDEQSQEYYQRERVAAYVVAGRGRWSASALLDAEREVARLLDFRLHRPTAAWFLRACVAAAGEPLQEFPAVLVVVRLVAQLQLMEQEVVVQPPALRAQAALLVALHAACSSAEAAERLWRPVQLGTCGSNEPRAAAECLAATLQAISAGRERWARQGLHAAESWHPAAWRALAAWRGRRPSSESLLPAAA